MHNITVSHSSNANTWSLEKCGFMSEMKDQSMICVALTKSKPQMLQGSSVQGKQRRRNQSKDVTTHIKASITYFVKNTHLVCCPAFSVHLKPPLFLAIHFKTV